MNNLFLLKKILKKADGKDLEKEEYAADLAIRAAFRKYAVNVIFSDDQKQSILRNIKSEIGMLS